MADLAQFKADAPKPKTISDLMVSMAPEFKKALPAHLKDNAERYMRLALTEMRRNPALAKCDPYSVLGAAMVASQLGLEPGPLGRAYLIPYGSECTFVPGWKGLLELATRSGRAFAWSGVLYEGQKHEYEQGDNPRLKVMEDSDEDDPAKIAYFYAIGRVRGSDYPVIERWSRARVIKHRDRFNKVGQRHYSYQHPEMYGRKVVLLQVLKYLPATPELEAAYMLDAGADRGQAMNLGRAADAIDGVFEQIPDDPTAPAPDPGFVAVVSGDGIKVLKALNEAKDRDTLDVAADLIKTAPATEREELTRVYKERREALQ